MKAVGFAQISSSTGPSVGWTKDEYLAIFKEFCDSLAHELVRTVITEVDPVTTNKDSAFSEVLNYLEEQDGGFLVIVPDATHVSEDLEGIARVAISIEKYESSIYCLEDAYPDLLQNAFLHMDSPGTSRIASNKIKASMQKRAIEGKALGRPPYGYRISEEGKFSIDPPEAEIVRLIYDLYTEGELGLRRIVDTLHSKGIKNKKGNDWNIVTIRDILKNTAYIGTYIRFGLRLTGNHEPVISPEIFRLAQDKVRERRRYRNFADSSPYLLSGLCVCGYCGNTMMGSNRKQSWRRDDGTRRTNKYRYYRCQSKTNKGTCSYHTWPTERLEKQVQHLLEEAHACGELQESMTGEAGDNKRLIASQKRLERVSQAENRFVEFMRKTSLGQSVLGRLEIYLKDLDLARDQAFLSVETDASGSFLQNWSQKNFGQQQAFLNEFVRGITVKDRVVKLQL